MENVTHTLIGVVLGEAIARARLKGRDPKEAESWRAGILWASVVGSNIPDLDIVLRPIMGGGSLGGLLHHRGYSHTVMLSLPLGLIAAGVGWLAARKSPRKPPWPLLWLAGWIGVLFHLMADSWNDYGVHPFSPWLNRWFYGDTIFILEPLLWLGLLPFVFRNARSSVARGLCLILGGGILALSWSGRYMTWPVALWMTMWALGWMALNRRVRSVGFAFAAIGLVLVIFAIPGQMVRRRLISLVPPGEKVLQLSATPAPSNPLCWRVIISTRTDQPQGSPPGDYIAREGVMVFQPWGLGQNGRFGPNNPMRCPPRAFGENNALWAQVKAPSLQQGDLAWAGEYRGNLKELAGAMATHCRLRALLRFVRLPFWLVLPQRDVIAGDLRYHSGNGLGFADIDSLEGEQCLRHEPPWDSPAGIY